MAPGGKSCQGTNFLRTLRQVREAAALGLIEGRDELETRLDLSKPRRVQAFQRFILEQLHKEDAGSSSSGAKNGNDETGSVGCVERLFALTSTQTQLPYDYYRLAFCKPETLTYKVENIGEVLHGSMIQNSPYELYAQKSDFKVLFLILSSSFFSVSLFTGALTSPAGRKCGGSAPPYFCGSRC